MCHQTTTTRMKVGNEISIHAPSTLAPRILCTGSESSKTTNPKLGNFPPTPFVLIRSSTTFPYAARKKKKKGKSTDIYSPCEFCLKHIDKCWFLKKHTHEELFELALINVMWEVTNKKLVAVRVTDKPPVVHVTRFSLSPATCRTEQQAPENSAQPT